MTRDPTLTPAAGARTGVSARAATRARTGLLTVAAVLAVTATMAAPAAAQQPGGRVLSSNGQPLSAASVEVWGRAEILHLGATDANGSFTLPELPVERITRYVFRHLGFGVVIVQVEDFVDGMEIVLPEEMAYELEGLEATVSRDLCPVEDEPEARERWASAAARYDRGTSRRGLGGHYRAETKDLSADDLFDGLEGRLDEVDIEMWESWPAAIRVEGEDTLGLDEMVLDRGYAWHRDFEGVIGFFGRDRHLNWRYPELDTRSAHHFVSGTFGSLHDFALGREESGGVRVVFCPNDRGDDNPSLEGRLLIGDDGTLVEAEWRYVTDDPVEDAGGWVRFDTAPDPDGGPPHLVAGRSLFYRHSGKEPLYPNLPRWYFRDLRQWTEWVVAPSDAEPAGGR